MSRRLIKQTIFASIVFLILLLPVFLVYRALKAKPTCFDGILNQEETEIDCGGQCIACELANVENLRVLWTKVIPNQDNFYDLAARIENPNQNYGSGKVPYRFELYDSSGQLAGEYAGTTFILPNQSKYLLQMRIRNTKSVKRANLFFGEIKWEKPIDFQSSQLVIQKKEYRLLEETEKGFSQAKALLINKTNFDFEKVDIDVLLFDSFRNLIAVNSVELRVLSSKQERDFVVNWFKVIEGKVSFVEIEAETNIFDSSNYTAVGNLKIEPFQEY